MLVLLGDVSNKQHGKSARWLVTAAALAFANLANANSANWDGNSAVGIPGDGVNWSDANNWTTGTSVDTAPGSSDDVTFGDGTVGVVNLNNSEDANSITFNAGFIVGSISAPANALDIFTGDVTVNPGVSAAINCQWSSSNLTLEGGGALILGGNNSTSLNGQIIIDHGTLTPTYSGSLGNGAPIQINTGGTLNLNAVNSSIGNITNGGIVNLNSAGAQLNSVTNSGTMNVNASANFGTQTNTGTYTVASGANYNGAQYADFTQSSGSLMIKGSMSLLGGNFYDNGGKIAGTVILGGGPSSPCSNLTFGTNAAAGGTFDLIGLQGSAATSYTSLIGGNSMPTGATLNINPSDSNMLATMTVYLEDNFTNFGAITISAAGLNHGVLVQGGALSNSGTINVNPGPTADGTRAVDVSFYNSGTVNINASTSTEEVTNWGTFNVAAGKTLSTNAEFTQMSGTLNINGDVNISSSPFYAEGGTVSGSGSVNVTNSSIYMTSGTFSCAAKVSGGTFNVQGGTITGTVTLAGADIGTGVVADADLYFGGTPAGSGTFNFVGAPGPTDAYCSGSLTSSNNSLPSGVTVNVNPSNTSIYQTFDLVVDNGPFTNNGTINLLSTGLNHAVELEGSTLNNAGTLNIDPGPTADGSRILSISINNSGTVNFNASATIPSSSLVNSATIVIAAGKTLSIGTSGSGSFNQKAGTLTIRGTLNLGSNELIFSGGSIEVDGAANIGAVASTLPYQSLSSPAPSLAIPGGKLTIVARTNNSQTNNLDLSSVSITAGGSFDLTNNELSIGYSDAAVSAAVKSYLVSGYAGGTWTGGGIVSSTAANSKGTTTLGYIDSGSQIQIMYTWIGDTNLDGQVTSADYAAISPTGTTWATGDFNYDGKVNADDFALFIFGAAEGGERNIFSTLPEPTFIFGASLLWPIMCRRRANLCPRIGQTKPLGYTH